MNKKDDLLASLFAELVLNVIFIIATIAFICVGAALKTETWPWSAAGATLGCLLARNSFALVKMIKLFKTETE